MEFLVEKEVNGEMFEVWQGPTGTIYFVKNTNKNNKIFSKNT